MEYEYSFKISKLDEYLNIIKEKYKYVNSYDEKRIIYRKKDIIGRVGIRFYPFDKVGYVK